MATNPIEPIEQQTLVRIPVPALTLAQYEAQAEASRRPLEDVLADRLKRSVQHSDQKPLYFTDAQRQTLESLLGKNLSTAKEALQLLQRCFTVKVNGASVTLKPTLLARLKSRCFQPDFNEWLTRLVAEELERYAGLR